MNDKNFDFLIQLLDKELEQEFEYRYNGDKNIEYITKCIMAKKYLYDKNNGGFVEAILLQDDVKRYIDRMGV